ncbi:MAG: YhcN/YlaJ family sporulation lipoprotein [Alicyclobacillus herbarius]|uniref:YhcN/YlaJ family sporulation lipoprotein n=1 Tax=Alicyclobacillus herbarius TaxID=122960 RepID=UPI00041816CE|nr:YhcN/YlaJ family sporulation lipoprotein [Alicyclobacillus herbarius]MCL6631272.1 YhcN/YlaJ family sporulation lipoprotein [Alicyclobacillus herbarius]
MKKFRFAMATAAFCLLSATACGTPPANRAANNAGNPAVTPRNDVVAPARRPTAPAANANLAVEQDIANRVVAVTHVRNANVLVAGHTAYVAVELRPGVHTGLAERTKDQIISVVKDRHPQIRTVYVSANPDVYQQFQKFARDIQQGQPVSAVWNQFSAMVQRVWPNAR